LKSLLPSDKKKYHDRKRGFEEERGKTTCNQGLFDWGARPEKNSSKHFRDHGRGGGGFPNTREKGRREGGQ